ncbi:MAG: c-type cytochrome [Deltaproteobacteria bacterium]|nr:c-type cytochrome [Nannocystaceae bacterium]
MEDASFRNGSLAFDSNHKFPNDHGKARTFTESGTIELDSAFSEDLGSNQRTCVTCHDPGAGWTITPALVQELFADSYGLDPIFRTNDGSNSPNADVSTEDARYDAYRLLLERAVIRVGMPIPAGAEFELVAVDDPYGFASANELSLFRRPLPSSNLPFQRTVMWDGRVAAASLAEALSDQANGATLGHAQALAPLSDAERSEIVDFEIGLFHAQHKDTVAGQLDKHGGLGGPDHLGGVTGEAGEFALYSAWLDLHVNPEADSAERREARKSIARGEVLFNTKLRSNGGGTCRACHSVKDVGNNANGTFFDVGVSAGSRRAPEVPLYTLRNLATGEERTTTDPGRALVTGLWANVDRFKTPALRGLAARAPYFHDGSAESLLDVIRHYEEALLFDFDEQEEADLVAFMAAL